MKILHTFPMLLITIGVGIIISFFNTPVGIAFTWVGIAVCALYAAIAMIVEKV